MEAKINTITRGETGKFLPGHSLGGRKHNLHEDLINILKENIDVTYSKIIDVTEGKALYLNGNEKPVKYNEHFWRQCVGMRWDHVHGRAPMRLDVKNVTPSMSDEEKEARLAVIDNNALIRAKDKLKTIEVNSESKQNGIN